MGGMGSAIMIEQLSRALARHCPHCPANERQPTACLLAAFLQGDYPWFTAARERDDARFMVYCRARRRYHASDVLSDATATALAEASEGFLRAIRDHALPRLDRLHHYANTDDTGGVAFRGVTFATATAKMRFVEALPDLTGQHCKGFTEQIEMALDFARVGEAVEPTMNPLQLQLAKFGYATPSPRSCGVLVCGSGFDIIRVHSWDGVPTHEGEVWVRGAEPQVRFRSSDPDQVHEFMATDASLDHLSLPQCSVAS